jgi:hypothetical protein
MMDMVDVAIPALNAGLMGAGTMASETTNYHFNQTVNTRATTPTVIQDFRMMEALVGA